MARILVAGPADLLSEQCRLVLDTKGFQLFYCADISAAVAIILEDPPDLLLLAKGFDGDGDLELIKVAGACLQKANMPIILALNGKDVAGLDWQVYPVDDILRLPAEPEIILARILLAESRMARVFDNNPLSKLPGNTSIIRAINRTLAAKESFAVCYVDIDNFKPYNDRYGFTQGDEVIMMVARLIVNVVDELARAESFVGHVGGDDFVFIIKTEMVDVVCEKILSNFAVVRNMFLSADDLAVGEFIGKDRQGRETCYDLLSLSIAVVTIADEKFKHYGEVSATASQLKHCVKKLHGNNYVIDRRDSYHPDAKVSE